MKKLLLIAMVFLFVDAIACVNEYRTRLNGELVDADAYSEGVPYYRTLEKPRLLRELAALDSLYKINKSHETLSDYGVILIYLGRLDEAIKLYRDIERGHPGLYATAANIGTAYELAGQVDSAYVYIKKAIALNTDSHHGSEWIHLKILEAKKKLVADPHYLQHNSILGLDFGSDDKPVSPKDFNLDSLLMQLHFQLGERMTFVRPKDQVVAQLLFDLGNITAIVVDVESALDCYHEAKEYGYQSALIETRIKAMELLALKATAANEEYERAEYERHFPWRALLVAAIVGVVVVWLVIRLFKKLVNKGANR